MMGGNETACPVQQSAAAEVSMPDGDRREIRTEAKTRHKAAQRITGASLTVELMSEPQ